MFLGYHKCEVMKEWLLPVQYTDQPMGSDDQIAPRSYHRLNNEKHGGVCRACKYVYAYRSDAPFLKGSVRQSALILYVQMSVWGLGSCNLHPHNESASFFSTWTWPLPKSTRTVGPWWGPLRFYAPTSTSRLVCRHLCFSSRWSWLARLVGSP